MAIKCDVAIVGAGIIGLTTAYVLKQRHPNLHIVIFDKEAREGVHASGRNSGVLHCGIYYGNESLKAKVCARGAKQMLAFAKAHHIPHRQSGKVIVATSEAQLPTFERLMQNAKDNDIRVERLSLSALHAREPAAAPGVAALYCPDTAVIDSPKVLVTLRALLTASGVEFRFNCPVRRGKSPQSLSTPQGVFNYGYLFNCAGAYADSLAKQFGYAKQYALLPFKGMYWKLAPEAAARVQANIYPVPDIGLPFLGVHLTRVMSGDVYVGPTAIPVLGRENYQGFSGMRFLETCAVGTRLLSLYARNHNNFRLLAHTELAKYRKSVFLAAAQKLMPSLVESDFVPTHKAGIRPQLMNTKTGKLEMDYIFEQDEHALHVLNAISPAFTSAFAFAEMIVERSPVF